MITKQRKQLEVEWVNLAANVGLACKAIRPDIRAAEASSSKAHCAERRRPRCSAGPDMKLACQRLATYLDNLIAETLIHE